MGKKTTCRILAFMAVCTILCSTGCTNLKDIRNIRIESFSIKSLSIKGLDSADAVFEVCVDNPAKDIAISYLDGVLYRSGKALGTFTIAPFDIEGRSSDRTDVGCSIRLAPGISPLTLMSMARDFDISDCTMDVTARARVGKSPQKKLTLKDIPVKRLINGQ